MRRGGERKERGKEEKRRAQSDMLEPKPAFVPEIIEQFDLLHQYDVLNPYSIRPVGVVSWLVGERHPWLERRGVGRCICGDGMSTTRPTRRGEGTY